MHKILLEKEIQIKGVNLPGTLTIYEEAQTAIDKKWESLYFPENNVVFATLKVGPDILRLITTGDVLITPEDGSYCYTNKNEYEIRNLIDSNSLNNDHVYDNNWFELYIVDTSSGGEDEYACDIFEVTPESLEELEEKLLGYMEFCIENYRG